MILTSSITISSKGDFSKTLNFLQKAANIRKVIRLEKYGKMGVDALAQATPKDTGETASSWGYEITETDGSLSIVWTNSHKNNGVPIAIILQYGHATGTGGYVQGIDYINPALRPIFEQIADEAWKEVTS